MVKTTVDLISSVLRRCGEVQDGTSPFATQALDYLNQIHDTVITGGNEFNIDVDEPWVWARARRPIILELEPYYSTGSVTLTQGSEVGTFSSAPTSSLEGYFLKLDNGPENYKIVQHTANQTSFEIDSAFPQASVSGQTFKAFLTDYDVVSSYIVIDSQNDTLAWIASGTTVTTATLTHGSYTPSDLATAVATAMHTADSARVYSASYNSITRLFTLTSDRASAGKFIVQGADSTYYKSAWPTLGFDYANTSDAASQTSVYPHSTIVRLTEPARCYYGSFFNYGEGQGIIGGIDPLAMDRDFPLVNMQAGAPTQFCVIREKNDGTVTVRFNKFPDRKMRVEFEHVPIAKALQNNTASIPLIPRKFIRLLEYGAAFYVCKDKRDSRADNYYQLAQSTLQSMLKMNRKELQRVGKNFGNVIARPDLMPDKRRNRLNLYGYDASNI